MVQRPVIAEPYGRALEGLAHEETQNDNPIHSREMDFTLSSSTGHMLR